ncbi:MAG: cbb3-type cytochrome oxidase assembly protein CcoS [Polymorphobacter sp.]|uniref:cbb3-type cytochrome oxidase assembly protein CcoS n=1 Tax=Polymorphobacter sp. TaxID=1909290 RepID=UPI003A8A055C
MSGLALLIPVALGLGLAGLIAFFWAIRSRQFDDLDGAALRILNDDQGPIQPQPPAGEARDSSPEPD